MGKVWLKALTICNIDEAGALKAYLPGDWFQCGKHQARLLEAAGCAIIKDPVKRRLMLDLVGCGILPFEDDEEAKEEAARLGAQFMLDVADGPLRLPFSRTLILGACKPERRFVPLGFQWLGEGWQLAVPLVDMETLAKEAGDEGSRQRTRKLMHDLRVPVYDTRLVFVLRCPETEAMIAEWAEERKANDGGLAFLRALYRALPAWTPLPPSWIAG